MACAYSFDEGLSEEKFKEIVFSCAKKIKRIEKVEIYGLKVFVTVSSTSGISSWLFELDFNHNGNLTEACYIETENYDSNIPKRLRELIYEKLEPYMQVINEKRAIEEKRKKAEREKIECERRMREEQLRREKKEKRKRFYKKYGKSILVFIYAIIFAIMSFIGYYQYSKLIPTKYSDEDLIGLSYMEVEEKLEKAGFTNVWAEETKDLTLEQIDLENKVFEIKISDDTDFEKDEKYAYDTKIVIQYHAIISVYAPISAEEIDEQNHLEIQTQFKNAGFVNVSVEPIYDVVFGWFDFDGEIENITIKGKETFYAGEEFRPDDKVVIKYHTLKKKKPKE